MTLHVMDYILIILAVEVGRFIGGKISNYVLKRLKESSHRSGSNPSVPEGTESSVAN